MLRSCRGVKLSACCVTGLLTPVTAEPVTPPLCAVVKLVRMEDCPKYTQGCLAGLIPVCTQHRCRHKSHEVALRSAYKSKLRILDALKLFGTSVYCLLFYTGNHEGLWIARHRVYEDGMYPLPQHQRSACPSRKISNSFIFFFQRRQLAKSKLRQMYQLDTVGKC